ncbi:hypothetical protein BFC22_04075 [Carnobacterium divergens]|uniref:helix-turn-helix domain-containing protein n=1 Tax=Carnobacterium divergens TaxID=2748 RepID=UPI000EF2AFE1|nr:XRE family transcriptional regulator [Carnobacterium divergens]ANZ99331.1 hypothetical protein BFC22_04075 [Carnobacterium divergens]
MLNEIFNNERLREARIYRGLSLEELGTELSELASKPISKQMISKFEQGLSIPDSNIIFGLIQILNFPRKYFYSTDIFRYNVGNSYFRALLSVSKKEKQRQILKIENIALMRFFLEEHIEFPKISLPDLSAIEGIEEKASELRMLWELGDKPIDNAVELLEEKGLVVTDLTFSDSNVDAFSQRISLNNGNSMETYYVIVLGNNKKSFYRRQFDSIHELAHLLLHEYIDGIDELQNDEYKNIERQADSFAGYFLLPADSFGKDVSKAPLNLNYYSELKLKWKVSIASMIVRAKQLEIITPEQYQSLFKSLSRKRWRKEEPLDSLTPQAKPLAFEEALDLLFEEGIYNTRTFLDGFSNLTGKYLESSEIEKLLNLENNYFSKYSSRNQNIVSMKIRK